MNYFFDTSALLKRYIQEKGSEKVDAIITLGTEIFVSAICELEIQSVLHRLLRKKEIHRSEETSIKTQFEKDLKLFSIVPIIDTVIENAKISISRHQLRSIDSIQFGSFIYVQKKADCFVSNDLKLIAACKKEHLKFIQL